VSRYGRIRALLATSVVIVAAVWGVGRLQSSADDASTHAIAAGQQMLIAMLDQETGLRGYVSTRAREFLEPYRRGRTSFDVQLAAADRYATDPADKHNIAAQMQMARQWQKLAESSSPPSGRQPADACVCTRA
jgi:methyl-accepting chemotaxis protein